MSWALQDGNFLSIIVQNTENRNLILLNQLLKVSFFLRFGQYCMLYKSWELQRCSRPTKDLGEQHVIHATLTLGPILILTGLGLLYAFLHLISFNQEYGVTVEYGSQFMVAAPTNHYRNPIEREAGHRQSQERASVTSVCRNSLTQPTL